MLPQYEQRLSSAWRQYECTVCARAIFKHCLPQWTLKCDIINQKIAHNSAHTLSLTHLFTMIVNWWGRFRRYSMMCVPCAARSIHHRANVVRALRPLSLFTYLLLRFYFVWINEMYRILGDQWSLITYAFILLLLFFTSTFACTRMYATNTKFSHGTRTHIGFIERWSWIVLWCLCRIRLFFFTQFGTCLKEHSMAFSFVRNTSTSRAYSTNWFTFSSSSNGQASSKSNYTYCARNGIVPSFRAQFTVMQNKKANHSKRSTCPNFYATATTITTKKTTRNNCKCRQLRSWLGVGRWRQYNCWYIL